MSELPRWRWDQYFSLLLAIFGLGLSQVKAYQPTAAVVVPQITVLQPQPVPIKHDVPLASPPAWFSASTSAYLQNPDSISYLTTQGVYVMDVDSGAVLYEFQASQPRHPASTAKLMTAVVARRQYHLNDVLTINEEALSQGQVIGFKVGEQVTVRDLLFGLLVHSGNDAAFSLANHHQLGYIGFVEALNQEAKELHLDRTNFVNPSGLDELEQLTTPRDLAILMREIVKDDVLREMVSTRRISFTDQSGANVHTLISTHELLFSDSRVKAGKTGTTGLAGEVLISLVEQDGHEIIIVVMGSQDRYSDTRKIIDWIYQTYTWVQD